MPATMSRVVPLNLCAITPAMFDRLYQVGIASIDEVRDCHRSGL